MKKPALAVDAIVTWNKQEQTNVLLIQRDHPPFKGQWAFPGGFVEEGEDLEMAAKRELHEETNLKLNALHQFQAYGDPDRDPRGHVVSVIFYGHVQENHSLRAGSDAHHAAWHSIHDLPALAFDHVTIMNDFLERHG